jgi:hypothetical protein
MNNRKYLVIILDRNTRETLKEYEIELEQPQQNEINARWIALHKFEEEVIIPAGYNWNSYITVHDYCADSILIEGE